MLAAARAWATEVAGAHAEVRAVVLFGSYARGDHGVGSDVDLLIEVDEADAVPGQRLPGVTGAGLPVPADILVYTTEELARLRGEGRRLARELAAGIALWPASDAG